MNVTRRQFLKGATAAGIGLALPLKFGVGTAHAVANSPKLAKWIQPIRNLDILTRPGIDNSNPIPTITPGSLSLGGTGIDDPVFANTTYFEVTVGEFLDQLHPDLGATRLWGYWDTTLPVPVQRHLGGVIIMPRGVASRIRFTNTLPTSHIIPVDTGIPGANQAQNRTATHLHGGLVPWTSDGGPFDWWAPNGASGLSFLNGPGGFLDNLYPIAQKMVQGQADYYYPNDQSTRLLWYHDHAHGITRLNAYAGIASGYLILDLAQEPSLLGGPAGALNGKIPSILSTMPLVFQDKVFVDPNTTPNTDPTWASRARPDVQSLGSLWYEHVYDPAQFRLLVGGRYLTPPNPSCIPEFFGDTMLCNGLVYPLLTVEPKAYRFLILNACNARFLNVNLLKVTAGAEITTDPNTLYAQNPVVGPNMTQIGTEGGYLVSEVVHTNDKPFNPATLTGNLLLGNAERADVIIDFTGFADGTEFIMYNDSPGPFPGGPPTTDFFLGNPLNPVQPNPGTGPDTRQILRIRVQGSITTPEPQPLPNILLSSGVGPDPALLVPITQIPSGPLPIPAGVPVRNLTLNEAFDEFGRLKQLLGTTSPAGKGFGRDYLAAPTEVVNAGATEVWRIFNLTADTHPIHFHLVNVQILSRQPFKVVRGKFMPTGTARGPEPNELGWKETVQMHPGEVITVIMTFDLPAGLPFTVPNSPRAASMGLTTPGKTYHEYVWHCHILEHEEHDMMRPLMVVS